jgi:hypothetical protein
MRVRAARYSASLNGVKTVSEVWVVREQPIDFETDQLVGQNQSLTPHSPVLGSYDDDDIIDVDYDDIDEDDVGAVREQPELTPPQTQDEFNRDDRVARYQKMMSGYSNAQFSARRSDDAMLLRDTDGYRRKRLA